MKSLLDDFNKSEDQLKSLQSVGQVRRRPSLFLSTGFIS